MTDSPSKYLAAFASTHELMLLQRRAADTLQRMQYALLQQHLIAAVADPATPPFVVIADDSPDVPARMRNAVSRIFSGKFMRKSRRICWCFCRNWRAMARFNHPVIKMLNQAVAFVTCFV